MSVKVMTWVMENAPYRGARYAILLAMADWARDDGGNIFPLVEAIAKKARLTKRHARRLIGAIERDGVLVREESGAGRANRARWRIVMDARLWTSGKGVKNVPFSESEMGAQMSSFNAEEKGTKAVTSLTEKGSLGTPIRGHSAHNSLVASIIGSVIDPLEIRQAPDGNKVASQGKAPERRHRPSEREQGYYDRMEAESASERAPMTSQQIEDRRALLRRQCEQIIAQERTNARA